MNVRLSDRTQSHVRVVQEHFAGLDPVSINLSPAQVVGLGVESLAVQLAESDEQIARKVDAIRSGDVLPSEDADEHPPALRGEQRRSRYKRFWDKSILELRDLGFRRLRPAPHIGSYFTPAGHGQRSSVLYQCGFMRHGKTRVALYLDAKKTFNEALFDYLYDQRQAIEENFGGELVWERLDDAKACRVYVDGPEADIGDDDTTLECVKDWMVEKLSSLNRVLGPILQRYGTPE